LTQCKLFINVVEIIACRIFEKPIDFCNCVCAINRQNYDPCQYGAPSLIAALHRKKVREFPVPSRDVTTKLSLGGNNDVITELFLPRGSLVSDIPAGDGKLVHIFYGVGLCEMI
jgi:hypothetical protein